MKRIFLFASCLFALFAEESSIQEIKAIHFVPNSQKSVSLSESSSCSVTAEDLFLFSAYPAFLHKIESTYIGQPLNKETMECLEVDVATFYRDKGQPFASIYIPKQGIDAGVLQVVVVEPKFGSMEYSGNRYSSPEYLRHFLPVKPGEAIDEQVVVNEMARMNQTPFRRTDAIWKAGEKPGSANLELATIDRFPARFYMGADNTGTIATDRDRFFFGLNFGKTIVEDSELSYQFTCAPNWNHFITQTALLRIPFPARQTFLAYGGYSEVQPKLTDHHKEKTISWQVDGRYRIPIMTNMVMMQEFLLGYDFKELIGHIRNNGKKIFYAVADIDQFMLGYDLGMKTPSTLFSLVAEFYFNPGGITTHNKTEDYEAFVPNSGPGYAYGKLTNSFVYTWDGWDLSYDLSLQASSKNLLPSEQFNLSGYYAVRGFEERIVSTDNALLLNLMLQAPRVSIGKLSGLSSYAYDEFLFYAFFDYGLGANHLIPANQSRTQSLASIGPGVRYQIDRFFSAHLDYGFQLFHYGFDNPTNSRYNFGLIVSF